MLLLGGTDGLDDELGSGELDFRAGFQRFYKVPEKQFFFFVFFLQINKCCDFRDWVRAQKNLRHKKISVKKNFSHKKNLVTKKF